MSRATCVAIVHYHLRPGGVTRVIQNALRSLEPHDITLVVLHGDEQPEDTFGGRTVHVPELDYGSQCDPATLLDHLNDAAKSVLGVPPDLWHIHNHSLGKNLAVAGLIDLMARRGDRLLLQIHDFPEDGRPDNYLRLRSAFDEQLSEHPLDALYPRGNHIHYALLNNRDRDFMLAAGSSELHTHLLPNPVDLGQHVQSSPPSTGPELILYPTRAIRRKNIGEFLLWSMTARADQRFGITLAPDNPDARSIYDSWVRIASELELPVDFNMAADRSFTELMAEATTLVTTSVAEGFGLAFLEPWLMGKPLTGRNIPEITSEFSADGIDLSGLYEAVHVPLTWVGDTALRKDLAVALDRYYGAYSRKLPEDATDRALRAACRDDRVDFGRLGEKQQEMVLRRMHASTEERTAIAPSELPETRDDQIAANQQAIRNGFSLDPYGRQLLDIYTSLAGTTSDAPDHLCSDILLDQFLKPERFNLLRT